MAFEDLPLHRARTGAGLEFHYVEDGKGLPLVFVHGGAGDYTSSSGQWDAFAGKYRAIAYSRRYSHPNANPDASATHSALDEADDLGSLIELWAAAPAILVASSYGALVALLLATRQPHLVRAMALVEPPLMQWADATPQGRQLRERYDTEVGAPAREAFLRGDDALATRIFTAGIVGSHILQPENQGRLQVRLRNARAMRAVALAPRDDALPAPAAVAALSIPTLLVSGANTQPLLAEVFRIVAQRMPQARTLVVPGSGHTVTRDKPAEFNRAVLDFLMEHGL